MSAPRWVRIGIGISAAWVAGAVIAAMFGDIRIARLLRYSELRDFLLKDDVSVSGRLEGSG